VIRRATADDADFVVELLTHEEVAPFLRPHTREAILERIERSQQEPDAAGVFVIEDEGRRAGVMEFERMQERNRLAHLGGLAVHPDFRGRRIADDAAREFQRHLLLDLGYHRLQMEVYGFNERSMAHAERAGWVREGVKRKAYRRHGDWVDGVTFAVIREDLGLPPGVDALYEHVARFNQADWEGVAECFAEDGVLEFEHIPIGPFEGREAIAAAYTEQPPDDEIRLVSVDDGDPVVGRYEWSRGDGGGTLTARVDDGLIARLIVA
jgi:RimJ/RimL family protein N-acetyltransferase